MIGKELADPGFAAEYLTVSLADSDPRVFLSALRRVADVDRKSVV